MTKTNEIYETNQTWRQQAANEARDHASSAGFEYWPFEQILFLCDDGARKTKKLSHQEKERSLKRHRDSAWTPVLLGRKEGILLESIRQWKK